MTIGGVCPASSATAKGGGARRLVIGLRTAGHRPLRERALLHGPLRERAFLHGPLRERALLHGPRIDLAVAKQSNVRLYSIASVVGLSIQLRCLNLLKILCVPHFSSFIWFISIEVRRLSVYNTESQHLSDLLANPIPHPGDISPYCRAGLRLIMA